MNLIVYFIFYSFNFICLKIKKLLKSFYLKESWYIVSFKTMILNALRHSIIFKLSYFDFFFSSIVRKSFLIIPSCFIQKLFLYDTFFCILQKQQTITRCLKSKRLNEIFHFHYLHFTQTSHFRQSHFLDIPSLPS